ncbi:MarR family winged helix-turn-helix transcriptional regulator [Pseudoscardovia suis]|uniref:Transcriptional regulator n=1 Tax=Pseudoscardovia suis TaxID=987063 RepID=A0A261F2V3_9BIFI|nr:MarR family winged helix-turn-helix transcriptional regulator [Pseudoscardovia suis]OZG53421.1 transcriptional regulator [Pseudoscardovia suis]PJJ68958.1 DNA-binding MarR family transcriptional regulator [Pseudoscardovia suis]
MQSPVLQMQALNRRITRYLHQTLPDCVRGATGGNVRVLIFLAHHSDRDIYQRDIEKAFGITRSTASRELTLLESNGMIARLPVEHDARLKRLVLTARGRDAVSYLEAHGEEMESHLFEGFTPEQIEQFTQFIHRMRANIERAMPADAASVDPAGGSGEGVGGGVAHQAGADAGTDGGNADDNHNKDDRLMEGARE